MHNSKCQISTVMKSHTQLLAYRNCRHSRITVDNLRCCLRYSHCSSDTDDCLHTDVQEKTLRYTTETLGMKTHQQQVGFDQNSMNFRLYFDFFSLEVFHSIEFRQLIIIMHNSLMQVAGITTIIQDHCKHAGDGGGGCSNF